MRVLDLFSGIGLGLERAGFQTVAFCEIEPYCQKVLAKHWPGVPIYDDIRRLNADTLRRDGITPDVICGGFPCQDLSFAGRRAGLEGERSGLWGEYARLIGELRPRFVIVENVPGLLSLGMGTVLGDLAALGYDATWDCIPASAVGAPHRRDRVWIVANEDVADAAGQRWSERRQRAKQPGFEFDASSQEVANTDTKRLPYWRQARKSAGAYETVGGMVQPESERCGVSWWTTEPDVGRVAHGVPDRVDRIKALGNAVVPKIPELIGHAIMRAIYEAPQRLPIEERQGRQDRTAQIS
jgi:DNA (cytosine-5)-methyltransferase 1